MIYNIFFDFIIILLLITCVSHYLFIYRRAGHSKELKMEFVSEHG